MPREFVCTDCGTPVFSFGESAANDQDICAECQWLRSIADPIERERLRQFLHTPPPVRRRLAILDNDRARIMTWHDWPEFRDGWE